MTPQEWWGFLTLMFVLGVALGVGYGWGQRNK
jgi:hypothetical protein